MPDQKPRISAIICTHNRAQYLDRALESLAGQTLPLEQLEAIVVDNASTDDTSQVVKRWQSRLPNLSYIREGRLGLSHARNTGLERSRARHVAYLDDDARAELQWLSNILRAFECVQPPPAAVGGPVRLDWEGDPPRWLPRRYWSVYTYVDHGPHSHFTEPHEYLVGANMAFQRSVLLDAGGFDVTLGRQGGILLSGEETAVLECIRRAGHPVYYAADAAVWHTVSPDRRRRQWLWKRMFWDGASQPLLDYGSGRSRSFYGRQMYLDIRRIGFFLLSWSRAALAGQRSEREAYLLAMIQRSGRLQTNLSLWRGA